MSILNTCIVGDNRDVLPTIDSGSIQLVVTSPPYDAMRTYGGHTWDFEAVARELYRVMCDGGIVCWNVGDSVVDGSETLTSAKQAIYFKETCGLRIHDTMIYEKGNFSMPERVRYYQTFEYIFVMSKGAPRAFNPIADRKNIYAGKTALGKQTRRDANDVLSPSMKEPKVYSDFGVRSNVWRGNTAGQENPCASDKFVHPAMMPNWLARDLIYSWSNPGDTVLDPFFGSGTTGKAAAQLGRNWIGIEVHAEYEKLSRARTAQTGIVFA